MIDTNAAVRLLLLQGTAVAAITGQRIWCPRPDTGYKPETEGSGIAFFTRGGLPYAEIGVLQNPSVQMSFYGADAAKARALYLVVKEYLLTCQDGVDLGAGNGYLKTCTEEVEGQDVIDEENDWNSVVTFYTFQFCDN